MEKSSCSTLALAGAVNQFWWAPVWNAFAPAEVKTWSSPSKVWLFEATWLYSLAISKIIVSVAVFGFPSGWARFHRRPFLRHISFPGIQTFFPETLLATSVQCHMFSCTTFLQSFVPLTSSQRFTTSGSFAPGWFPSGSFYAGTTLQGFSGHLRGIRHWALREEARSRQILMLPSVW